MSSQQIQEVAIRSFDKAIDDPRSKVKRLFYRIIPRHILRSIPFELRLALLRITSRKVKKLFANSKHLLVNLGAGPRGKLGWVNVDAIQADNVNCLFDCRRSLPFPDNSVKGIFVEHFFEHLDYHDEVPDFLRECYRVLEPNGVLRIIVPDGGAYLRAYSLGGWDELKRMRMLGDDHYESVFHFAYSTRMELINFVFRQWGQHKFAYDFETVSFVLRKYGFSSVQQVEFGRSISPELCIDSPERQQESLYVDAIKG